MELTIQHLNKRYNKKMILNDINLTVASGDIVGLIGPNGVGKTTLLKILANVITDYEGDIYFDGISNKNIDVFQRVSLMQTAAILYPHLTGYDYLSYLQAIYKLNKSAVKEVIDLMNIDSFVHQKIGTYSLGMQQQLLMAMALINRPSFLILDEPFNGLDPSRAIAIKQILAELNRTGMTILLSSHQLSIVEEVTDKVYFLKAGHLFPFEISAESGYRYQLQTSDNQYLTDLLRQNAVECQLTDNVVELSASDIDKVLGMVQQTGITIRHLNVEKQSLEATYQSMYEMI